jgi:hypothetical protein
VVALLSACGHDTEGSDKESDAAVKTEIAAAPSPTTTDVNNNGKPDSDASDKDWPGKMTVVFEDATSPDAIRGRKFMEDNNLLQQLADDMNSTLKLPYDIPIKGSQCDEPNDFWSPSNKSVTMCYEDATNALDIFTKLGDPDPAKAAFNTELEAFYHESGHMVIDIYDLPATGREEDAADQVSTYMLLRPNPDGSIDPDSIAAIKDTARLYQASADPDNNIDERLLADEHSPDKTRMYNFECWAYGADPKQTQDLVGDGMLPEARAENCADEYEKLSNSWSTLLGPYFK